MDAGFAKDEVFREDTSHNAGSITTSIVEHISNSDIVIADLTGRNANVYYELGLAHVFHKNATIIICQKGEKINFDVSDVKRVEYEAELTGLTESRRLIAEEIRSRLQGKSTRDNKVHEVHPAFPAHLIELLEARDDNQLEVRLREVSRERDALKAQLHSLGLRASGRTETRSIRTILSEAKQRMKYSGTSLIDTLQEYASDNKWEEFLDYLSEAMEYGTPTLPNINSIVEICSQANNDAILEDVLCASRILYPDDSELMTRLAKLYARRPGAKKDAMEMVNSAIGLSLNENGEYELSDPSKLGSHNELARFMDTYLAMQNYDGLINAARFLKNHVHVQEQRMLDRNIFTAMYRKGDLEGAREMLPTISEMQEDMAQYLIAQFYHRCGDFVREYEYLERAMISDPEDSDYPRMLGVHMLNEDLVRTQDGIVKVKPAESRRAAAAMFYYSVENDRTDYDSIRRVLEIMQRPRNKMQDYLEPLVDYVKGISHELSYDNTNTEALDYLLRLINVDGEVS
jgi:tetratricopeptide (TPR) repeat protein